MLIPKASFTRLLKDICNEDSEIKYRWTSDAVTVMQAACEDYMVALF
jgi:histone H3/H4